MRKTKLARAGLTWEQVQEIAAFYHMDKVTVWRYAVGQLSHVGAPPGMLRSMLHLGWKPAAGAAQVRADIAARQAAMWGLDKPQA